MVQLRSESMVGQLRASGLRATQQRLAIAQTLQTDNRHPSAEQVLEKLKPHHPTLSLSTVYKTLHTITEVGLAQTIDTGWGPQRFDGSTAAHHHLCCRVCGQVTDLPGQAVSTANLPAHLPASFTGQSLKLYLVSTCNNCT